MKKYKHILFLILSVSLILSSCGQGTDKGQTVSDADIVTASVSSEGQGESEEIIDESVSSANSSSDLSDYFSMEQVMEFYTDYLKNLYPQGSETASNVRYYLAWINEDSIPELVYMEGNYHFAGVHVCICDKNGTVSDIGEFGEYGNFAYKQKKGNILSFYMNSGVYFLDFYSLKGMSIMDDRYFEVDEGSSEDESTHYYIDGDEVDEEEYYKIYKAMNSSSYTNLNYDDALSYNNTDDILRVLTEFSTTGSAPSIINVSSAYPNLPGEWVCSMANLGDNDESIDADTAKIGASLFISDAGNITFSMNYEDNRIEDLQMVIKELYKDENDSNYVCLGFSNQEATREFLVFTSENNTITATITDFSGTFSTYNFNLVFIKSENEEL